VRGSESEAEVVREGVGAPEPVPVAARVTDALALSLALAVVDALSEPEAEELPGCDAASRPLVEGVVDADADAV
jgi:hypothetical protein